MMAGEKNRSERYAWKISKSAGFQKQKNSRNTGRQ